MLKKVWLGLCLILLLSSGVSAALADESDLDLDYPWRGHAAPFDHFFGNMIDGHQQSQILKKDQLHGFIYVEYTGEVTETGLPVAKKASCSNQNRSVGWVVKGVPISAQLVNQSPRIWLVDQANLPVEPGYTHFHWIGSPQKPPGLVVGQEYFGYLMKRVAPVSFFWLGGGQNHSGGGSGGCGGEEGGCEGEEGGCGGEEGGCGGEEGGCEGEKGGCGGEEGGCKGGGGSGGSSHGGHSGRVVPEGVDPHSNIITAWDGTWSGCGSCSSGCGED